MWDSFEQQKNSCSPAFEKKKKKKKKPFANTVLSTQTHTHILHTLYDLKCKQKKKKMIDCNSSKSDLDYVHET